MTRRYVGWFLALLVGLSGVAYALTGTSPPVDIPNTITQSSGNTASCGSGGPTLTIPAGAVAVGYTTCALDFDPENGVSCVAGSCVNISPISNWLDILNCNDYPTFHHWYISEDGLPPSSCGNATSQFTITSDGGSTVLQMTYLHIADFNAGIADAKMGTTSPFGNPNPPGTTFPQSNYTETVVRFVYDGTNNQCPASQDAGGCLVADSWSYSPEGVSAGAEWDFVEIYTNGATGGGGGGLPFASGPTGLAQPGRIIGFDRNAYNNYGVRATVDANFNASLCHYMNNSQITNDSTGAPPCTTGNVGGRGPTARNGMIQEVGPQGLGIGGPRTDQIYMVRRFTVWTCGAWQTTTCPTNQNTGSP